MNRERLTTYEEAKIIVYLKINIEDIKRKINNTELDILKDIYNEDIEDFKTIINKLK